MATQNRLSWLIKSANKVLTEYTARASVNCIILTSVVIWPSTPNAISADNNTQRPFRSRGKRYSFPAEKKKKFRGKCPIQLRSINENGVNRSRAVIMRKKKIKKNLNATRRFFRRDVKQLAVSPWPLLIYSWNFYRRILRAILDTRTRNRIQWDTYNVTAWDPSLSGATSQAERVKVEIFTILLSLRWYSSALTAISWMEPTKILGASNNRMRQQIFFFFFSNSPPKETLWAVDSLSSPMAGRVSFHVIFVC